MTTRVATTRLAAVHRGFTLVEVLIAIIILLVGVVAALRIFPRGFEIFTETQQSHTAFKLVDLWVNEFEQNPDSLPDAILPVSDNLGQEMDNFRFGDLAAVEYAQSSATVNWYSNHLFGTGRQWPLWQPLSTRVLRRLEGERCVIPSEISSTVNSVTNVAFLPKYFPRFGPVVANGMRVGASYWLNSVTVGAMSVAQPLQIYDLRYQRVAQQRLDRLATQTTRADVFAYAVTPTTLTFLPLEAGETDRFIRFTGYCFNPTTRATVYIPPTVNVIPNPTPFVATNGTTITFTWDAAQSTLIIENGWQLVVGSEQINRAYRFANTVPLPPDANATQAEIAAYVQALAALPTGSYFVDCQYTDASFQQVKTPFITGAVYFSRKDAGKTVKIDYTLADWNILHQDVTVDDNGYVQLDVPDPKITNQASYPREPKAWGLYRPMKSDGSDEVFAVVDLRTGAEHAVKYNPAGGGNAYTVVGGDPENPVTAVDLKAANRGRVRFGGGSAADPDWEALQGRSYRIYYRARRDWTLQVFRAPATFWQANGLADDQLWWNKFARKGTNTLVVPGVYEGHTVLADYQYRQELCRAVRDSADPTVTVNSVTGLSAGMTLNMRTPSSPDDVQTVTVDSVDAGAKTITLTLPVGMTTVSEGTFFFTPGDARLLRAGGEVHTLTQREGKVCRIRLRHMPEPHTAITLRGASVTVRAMWIQPRSGPAHLIDGPQLGERAPINERWQAKSMTVILPMGKE